MKQISIQITDMTARQMAQLALHWGLPPERHNTPVVERAVAVVHMLEIQYDLYKSRLEELKQEGEQTKEKQTMEAMVKQFDMQMPLVLRVFENALRSGYNIVQSLDMIATEVPEPAGKEARRVADETRSGTPLPEALNHWLERVPSNELNLLIATLRVQLETGGNLADKLQLLSQIMTRRTP